MKGKKKRNRDSDGSNAQKVLTLQAPQVAGLSLPGLYKSRHLPQIDPDTLSACEDSSGSDGIATDVSTKQQEPGSQEGPADVPQAPDKQVATKPEQEPGLPRFSKSPGLKRLKGPPVASAKGPGVQRISKKALPGRLRKKLAKEGVHGVFA